MKATLSLVLVAAFSIAFGVGCLSTAGISARVVPLHDRFSAPGQEAYRLKDNDLEGPKARTGLGGVICLERIEFDPAFMKDPSGGPGSFRVWVMVESIDWLFIEEGESLVLLMDGERVTLVGGASVRETGAGCIIEVASYPVDEAFLRRFCTATSVELKVKGSKGSRNAKFSKKNIENVCKFVEQYAPATP